MLNVCPEVAQCLIENGAQIDAKDQYGETPLHIAARCDNEDLTAEVSLQFVTLLIEKRAQIDAKDQDECTPLHRAVLNILWVVSHSRFKKFSGIVLTCK